MLLRRHVKECPRCEARLEKTSAVVDALSGIQRVEAPGDFAATVMARLLEATEGRQAAEAASVGEGRGLFWVAGAAGLGLAIGVGVAVARHVLGRHPAEELAVAGHAPAAG